MRNLLLLLTLIASPPVLAGEFPDGSYVTNLEGDHWLLAFSGGEVRVFRNSEEVIRSRYQVTSNRIRFSQDQGIYSCVDVVSAGTYRWHFNSTGLNFSNIDDQCPGRISVLTTKPWQIKDGMTTRIHTGLIYTCTAHAMKPGRYSS